jgi:queuosine precursor transporter
MPGLRGLSGLAAGHESGQDAAEGAEGVGLMIWVALYAASIVAANVLITVFGLVPVGFGLLAPAGVYAAGLAFWLRDQVHDALGVRWTVLAIVLGALLSAGLSPSLALASGVAFLVSEMADLCVYTPLRERGHIRAVVASNVVGLIVDSALFLALAFGNLDFLAGQIVGKLWTLVPVVLWLWWMRPGHAKAHEVLA